MYRTGSVYRKPTPQPYIWRMAFRGEASPPILAAARTWPQELTDAPALRRNERNHLNPAKLANQHARYMADYFSERKR